MHGCAGRQSGSDKVTLHVSEVSLAVSAEHVAWFQCVSENCVDKFSAIVLPYKTPNHPLPNRSNLLFNAIILSVGVRLTIPMSNRDAPLVWVQSRSISVLVDKRGARDTYSAKVGSIHIEDIRPYAQRGVFSQVVRGMWRSKSAGKIDSDPPLYPYCIVGQQPAHCQFHPSSFRSPCARGSRVHHCHSRV